jgi:coenzyme F420-reducing hydrogenase alpha subunit
MLIFRRVNNPTLVIPTMTQNTIDITRMDTAIAVDLFELTGFEVVGTKMIHPPPSMVGGVLRDQI